MSEILYSDIAALDGSKALDDPGLTYSSCVISGAKKATSVLEIVRRHPKVDVIQTQLTFLNYTERVMQLRFV